jgi:Flp pilus assembly protein TadG
MKPITLVPRIRTRYPRALPGQGMVEFALAGTLFLMVVLGTLDLGHAVFRAAELHNAVREGAAVGRLRPTDTTAIKAAVVGHGGGNGLTASAVTVACAGGCATGGTITVSASSGFTAVTQALLGIAPITLNASATVDIE